MAFSSAKFSYQRLKNEGQGGDDYDSEDYQIQQIVNNSEYQIKGLGRPRSWYRRSKRVPIRRKFKLKIPSLRRLLRRKSKLVSSVRVSISNVVKRLKESQSHLSDLFAGNYMFLQVSPTSLKCLNKASTNNVYNLNNGFSSRYPPKIAN
ncbi:uncharacterized protein LOC133030342 [Cannabis sativa]|uniref:uncharacterized protein LOC133030342 n=1 Tax=Cannabis sativa TaxID=3483 RepID=UPI0029C9C7B2|nr:uncharacterized protein LOC133030342 [Cannabis sativa]